MKVIDEIENFDFAIGELMNTFAFMEVVAGPFTGIEYFTPALSYHCALVRAFSTIVPRILAFTEVKVFLLV